MGLPVFITPAEPEVASTATEKVAAVPRSSIRRQRTIRGGSQARSSENRRRFDSSERRRRIHYLLDSESRETQENASADTSSIASLQARADRFFQDVEDDLALNERTVRDSLSWERRRTEGGYPNPSHLPPAPDPELEAQVRIREREMPRSHHIQRDLQRDIRRMGRRRPAPTPPYTEMDLAFTARGARDSPRPSSLTPALSPALLSPPEGDTDTPAPPWVTVAPATADIVPRRYREMPDEHNHSSLSDRPDIADRVRAFNRISSGRNVGRSSVSFRQFLRSRMDGLGDRDRSLSPEGGAAWDTLLTSITPDPQPPSAGSSFASSSVAAAAAAASSSSNSVPTWVSAAGTRMTSPERSGESAALRDCIESSDSDTEHDDEELESLNDILQSNHRGGRYWRSSYADVARDSGDAPSPDVELGGMQRIISRLAERDDIPNSWWASVGLRREPSA